MNLDSLWKHYKTHGLKSVEDQEVSSELMNRFLTKLIHHGLNDDDGRNHLLWDELKKHPKIYLDPANFERKVKKARALAAKESDAFVLAADTVVALGRRSLGKPKNVDEARQFLKMLSGRRHRVLGGVSVVTPDGQSSNRISTTLVRFKRLSESEISRYLETGEWDGKAGGYAIQGYAAAFIPAVSGSYTNVVGLDLAMTRQMLEGLGYRFET